MYLQKGKKVRKKTGRPSPIQWQKCEISYQRKFILVIDSKSLREFCEECFRAQPSFQYAATQLLVCRRRAGKFSSDNFRFEFAW
ncbi:hypothetical protein CEXT_802611 [Caerostris extrusa]|uniref:Ribosomal protein S14 n=1 Tax=Caerostris extrusa TaxID=172846 RepID=A0AAV4XAT4_CAEEX|nr:hypothetical protein CEXT_802611 [Caerostris extrusa]